jgi:hypothetical protein
MHGDRISSEQICEECGDPAAAAFDCFNARHQLVSVCCERCLPGVRELIAGLDATRSAPSYRSTRAARALLDQRGGGV